ncbi:hypothetical protein POTOM_043172 [Populus tomentosa]|uniref:40S ribosomal protein S30 n=1 Tax=Populus tomentosa TaxID=118781 RepID=A0A8X7YH17_POPTO|nr:hypothetical protein POTOM_043172 [Populus tomentosa]
MGKVHGSLARAGKVRGQTPKVAKQDKKKKPRGRAHKRMQYNRRFVTADVLREDIRHGAARKHQGRPTSDPPYYRCNDINASFPDLLAWCKVKCKQNGASGYQDLSMLQHVSKLTEECLNLFFNLELKEAGILWLKSGSQLDKTIASYRFPEDC